MKTYTHNEARQASLAFFQENELPADVYLSKYALRQGDVFYESKPPETSMRLAKEFARSESKFCNPMCLAEVYGLLMDVDYSQIHSAHGQESEEELINAAVAYGELMPQGSPTAAMGNPFQIQSMSNCFVIDSPYDSYGGICHTDEEQAQIMKRRGGVGFDISTIRPKGQPTSNAARTTDGIGVFMKRYSSTTEEVAQNGRRGALMLTISCFVGTTNVLTEDGWKQIKDVVETEYFGKAWTHEGYKDITAHQSLGERDVYEVECENGRKITVTADHKFVVYNIQTCEEYLKPICDVDHELEELVFYDVTLEETC